MTRTELLLLIATILVLITLFNQRALSLIIGGMS
jgi:hypothetical protein